MTVAINAETRVAELIEAYPEAEEILIGLAPQFKALRNPVLRRTVARVASLEQAARVGGLEVRQLVLALRSALGVEGEEIAAGAADEGGSAPDWIADTEPSATLDADALLADGRTPVSEVMATVAGFDAGQVLLVEVSFHPAPLVDAVRSKGHELHCEEDARGRWRVWIRRA